MNELVTRDTSRDFSPDFAMIAKGFGFPVVFLIAGNAGRIAKIGKAAGKSKNKRGRETLVRNRG